jgi:hypothetical protein
MRNPFRCFNSSPEVIRLTVMLYIRYPLSLRLVEDLLFERAIDICYETVSSWRWHLDELFVKINGEMPPLSGTRELGWHQQGERCFGTQGDLAVVDRDFRCVPPYRGLRRSNRPRAQPPPLAA